MEEGKLVLSNDKSPLKVIRVKFEKTFWYYIPEEKVFITSSGSVVPGLPPQSGGDEGTVIDDVAVAFRILIQSNKLTQFILSKLPKNLFIEEKDNNAKKVQSKGSEC